MGQAFDRNGNVLGDAFGDTKREVFDKLNAAYQDAHEIRIQSLGNTLTGGPIGAAQTLMPKYRCHKEVYALKIERIEYDNTKARDEGRETDGSAMIVPADPGYAPFRVDRAYLQKHDPHFGGYYVVYEDGYKSFSPAAAFESGYTRIS